MDCSLCVHVSLRVPFRGSDSAIANSSRRNRFNPPKIWGASFHIRLQTNQRPVFRNLREIPHMWVLEAFWTPRQPSPRGWPTLGPLGLFLGPLLGLQHGPSAKGWEAFNSEPSLKVWPSRSDGVSSRYGGAPDKAARRQ